MLLAFNASRSGVVGGPVSAAALVLVPHIASFVAAPNSSMNVTIASVMPTKPRKSWRMTVAAHGRCQEATNVNNFISGHTKSNENRVAVNTTPKVGGGSSQRCI